MNICVCIALAALCLVGVSEGLECFNCQNIADPTDCTNTTQCSSGQSCSLLTIQADSNLHYNMGCQDNQQCTSSAVSGTGIIGRSIQIRQQHSCHECCGTDRCNDHLCAYRKPSACTDDETLDCARMNSIFNVCADIHHAKLTCPKFCGLCQLVDGGWTEWGTWTSCSVTCENGKQSRTRTCANPPPSNGGLNCTGPTVESQLCTKQMCPVHGNWSEWSAWSGCSVSCDVGLRKKTRTCTNPRPDRFGDNCYDDASEYTVCLNEPCSVRNGGWSSWGSWQSCSVTCGVGLKLRSRTCTNPSPTLYGKGCEGNFEAFAVCVNTPCNVVAFNVHGFNELSNNVNAFPSVIFNEGNAYNPNTGHFTAPVNGIYYFTAHFCSNPAKVIVFSIDKTDASMSSRTHLTSTYELQSTFVSCTSISTSVKLNRDEHVCVLMDNQFPSENINAYYHTYNTFTGTLIQEL